MFCLQETLLPAKFLQYILARVLAQEPDENPQDVPPVYYLHVFWKRVLVTCGSVKETNRF